MSDNGVHFHACEDFLCLVDVSFSLVEVVEISGCVVATIVGEGYGNPSLEKSFAVLLVGVEEVGEDYVLLFGFLVKHIEFNDFAC